MNHRFTSQSLPKAEAFLKVVRLLKQMGAKSYLADESGRNALQLATQFGFVPVISLLVDAKSCSARCNSGQTYKGWSIFHFASYTRFRWKMTSNLLLKEGASGWREVVSYLGTVWSEFYFDLQVRDISQQLVHRDEVWRVSSSHSKALLDSVISHCSAFDWDTSHLLQEVSQKDGTVYHLLANNGDHTLLRHLIDSFPAAWNKAQEGQLLNDILHIAAFRGHHSMVSLLVDSLDRISCLPDSFGRLPAEAWHLKQAVPQALYDWQEEKCVDVVPVDQVGARDTVSQVEQGTEECSISAVSAEEINPELFLRDYLSVRRPIVIRGLLSSWPALSRWNSEYFTSKLVSPTIGIVFTDLFLAEKAGSSSVWVGKGSLDGVTQILTHSPRWDRFPTLSSSSCPEKRVL